MLVNSFPETTVNSVYRGNEFQDTKDGKEARSPTWGCNIQPVGEQLLGVSQRSS